MHPVIFFLSSIGLLWAVDRRVNQASLKPATTRVRAGARGPTKAAAPRVPKALSAPAKPRPAADATLHARLRDRYIAARFPGVVSSSADLAEAKAVIDNARLLFEEDRGDSARELLLMAIDQSSSPEPLRLARLEIAYLQRDAAGYVELAREFHERHPQSHAWAEVVRLGHALAPREPLFADSKGERPHEHYGAWPDTPNWINASWDLTSEVSAVEFHNAMRNEGRK